MQLFFQKNVGNGCVKSLFQSRCGKELPVFETRIYFLYGTFYFYDTSFLVLSWSKVVCGHQWRRLNDFRIFSSYFSNGYYRLLLLLVVNSNGFKK